MKIFALYDTFEILDVLLKFTKMYTREMTKFIDNIFFLLLFDILAHSIEQFDIWDILINIWNKTCFFRWEGATTNQQNGDFVFCDTFEILYVLLKFTKISTKETTRLVDNSIHFFLLIFEHTALKSFRY